MAPPLTSIRPTMGMRDWSMLVLLSVLFGGAFFFVGVSVADLPALVIVTSRVVLAAMALLCIAMMQRARLPTDARSLRAFIAMGLLNSAIPFLLITWAQAQIPSGLAAILNATTPLFTVVIASLALADEKATFAKLLGVVLGICGVWVIFGLPTEHSDSTVAQIAVLTAALSYACAGVYGRRMKAMGLTPVVAAGGQLLAAAAILVPITLATADWSALARASQQTWLAVVGLALVSTAGANVLYFRLLGSVGATNLLLVALLIPVSALLLGWLFLNEALEPPHLLGMSVIALGLAVIDGRVFGRRTMGAS